MSMVTDELVPLVDKQFRTAAEPRARMIIGFSLGGFGAWNIGLARPDVFSHIRACAPTALSPENPAADIASWDNTFQKAYGWAVAPEAEAPWYTVPDNSASPENQARLKKWYSGMGDVEGKIQRCLAQDHRLISFRIDCGLMDPHAWLVSGVKHDQKKFVEAGLPLVVQTWDEFHTMSSDMIEKGFIPFATKAFEQYW